MVQANQLKIYVASSWKNEKQPSVVKALRNAGHQVYDFKNPESHFHWHDIDPDWHNWSMKQYIQNLHHPKAIKGFDSDMDALSSSDIVVGVQPFGCSASMEMGWAAGVGKDTILLLNEGERPELMVNIFTHLCMSIEETITTINNKAITCEGSNSAGKLCDAMTFGLAIEAMKKGYKVSRAGWNRKGMFIVLMPSLSLPPYNTQGADRKVNDRTAKWIGKDKPLDSQPYFAMYTAQGKWQPGWLVSQADMLAEDWFIVESYNGDTESE